MIDHPDRLTILAFIEDAPLADRAGVGAHIRACPKCTAAFEDLQELALLLGDPDLHDDIPALSVDRSEMVEALLADKQTIERESEAAERFFLELLGQPIETWEAMLATRPGHRTAGMVRRLLAEAQVELDLRPAQALLLADIAAGITPHLPHKQRDDALGDVWKMRSNAFRQLGRYEESLEAAVRAEAYYDEVITGAFDVAQAQYARAVTLFKMTRYAEALQVLDSATAILRDFGASSPLAKTMMLEAAIRLEQGNVRDAEKMWRDVLPVLESLGDAVEHARALANLAECNLRLGHYDHAERDARAAVRRYRALRIEAESIRSEWTLAMVQIARGNSDEGLVLLEKTAAAFAAMGMLGDAGFVKLDVVEELLNRGDWGRAESTARELATLFTAAGVTTASVLAIDFLRQAVESGQVTTNTIEYVRAYVAADDPSQPFILPDTADA